MSLVLEVVTGSGRRLSALLLLTVLLSYPFTTTLITSMEHHQHSYSRTVHKQLAPYTINKVWTRITSC